jgi:hypothetical protein
MKIAKARTKSFVLCLSVGRILFLPPDDDVVNMRVRCGLHSELYRIRGCEKSKGVLWMN